jgi:hypothetical protein
LGEREAPVQQAAGAGPDRAPPRRRTPVALVCSPQTQAGTTLTARLLLDYVLSGFEPALGFDTNRHEPGLAAVFPRCTTVADLASTRGQMALFDTLIVGDGVPKVIDLWHVSYWLFFQRAADLGFFEEAWSRGIEPLILLHTDRKKRFVDEAGALLARWPGLDVVLVHNRGLTDLRDGPRAHPAAHLAERPLIVPKLDAIVLRILEEPEIRVHRVMRATQPDGNIDLQQKIGDLAPIFDQFRLVELARDVGLPGRSMLPRGTITRRRSSA